MIPPRSMSTAANVCAMRGAIMDTLRDIVAGADVRISVDVGV